MPFGENGKYMILPNSRVLKRLQERNHEKILHFFRKRKELTKKRSEVTESLWQKKGGKCLGSPSTPFHDGLRV